MTRRTTTIRLRSLAALALGGLAACGDEGASTVADPDRGRVPSFVPPSRPERVFSPQTTPVGSEYAALVRRLDPTVGGAPREAHAALALRETRRFVSQALEDPVAFAEAHASARATRPVVAPPTWRTTLRRDRGVVVERDVYPEQIATRAPEQSQPLVEALRPLTALLRTNRDVEFDVTVQRALRESGQLEADVRARFGSRLGGGGLQVNTEWTLTWDLTGGAPTVTQLHPRRYEEVRLGERAFLDATATALAEVPGATSWLQHGALAASGRTDALVPRSAVAQGMHGCAVGDIDGDGYEDLYVARIAGQPNLLLLGGPGGVASEAAREWGVDFLDDSGGVLIVDLDGDGWRDLVLGVGSEVVVAWNEGGERFEERTRLRFEGGARVYSLAAADVDGDGDVDLYDTRYFRSGGYGDQAPTPYHDARNGASNRLWLNALVDEEAPAPRTFRDATPALGLDSNNDRFSLAALFEDFDRDGDLDLYVANDFGRNNLYLSRLADTGRARFVDVAEEVGLEDQAAGMGLSAVDADLDGNLDVLVTNMWAPAGDRLANAGTLMAGESAERRAEYARHARGNTLFRGLGGGRFEDVTERAGMGPAGWAWGARFIDWNRDGLADIVSPNGFQTGRRGPDLMEFFWREVVGRSPGAAPATAPYLAAWATISRLSQLEGLHWNAREATYAYLGVGGLAFVDASLAAGIATREDGRASAIVDWDQDGRLDLWLRNRTAPTLRLLRGAAAPDAKWLAVRLAGRAPNTDAVGAEIELGFGAQVRRARVVAGDGFLSGSTLELHFGLGAKGAAPDYALVTWPDGERDAVTGLAPGRRWLVERDGPRTDELLVAQSVSERPARPMPAAERPLPDALSPQATEVPLLDPFPLAGLRLPRVEGAAVALADIVGPRGAALVLGHLGVEESRAALEAALRDAPEVVAVHGLLFDEDDALVAAYAEALDAGSRVGRADRSARLVVEMLLGRTLGPFLDLPLPIVLEFDAAGDLWRLQVGDCDPARFGVDLGPAEGTWIRSAPRRRLRALAPKLRQVGLPALADDFEGRAR